MRNVTYSTETLNNVDYLVARVGTDTEIVEFQTRMLTYADLEGLIATSKRQINDNIAFYYDITSKKTLAQTISERKVSRPDFLNMLSELISTFKQLSEYHLVGSGVVLDKEYIYINDADFSPSLIYLPIEKSGDGIENIKHFILDLILSSKIESASDNFIQIILDTLNSDSFSIEALEHVINEQKDGKKCDNLDTSLYEHSILESVDSQLSGARKNKSALDGKADFKSAPNPRLLDALEHSAQNNSEQENISLEKPSFLQKRKTSVFVGIHVIAAAILITYIASGAFIVDGQLQVLRIAVFLFIVVAAELIVFHVTYVNAPFALRLRFSKPTSPNQQDEQLSPPKRRDELVSQLKQRNELVSSPKQQQRTSFPYETQSTSFGEDIIKAVLDEEKIKTALDEDIIRAALEGDKTVLMDIPGQGYLKGIDNTCNYLLNKPIAIIGRSQKKADYVLTSERVGRKHAIIIYDGKRSEYSILDRDSLNGTYVNNERIPPYQLYPLKDGDMIRFADSEFMITVPHRDTERNFRVSDCRSLSS